MAVIDRASMSTMQVVAGTVDTLPTLVQGRTDLKGPAMVLLGEVVGLRERLAGSLPPSPPATSAALQAALAVVPGLDADGLRTLRARIDELLESGSTREDADSAPKPPAKRLAGE